jgi:hypothetical protein
VKTELLNPQNSAVIFIDHQPQMTFGVASIDRQSLFNNVILLAKAASEVHLGVERLADHPGVAQNHAVRVKQLENQVENLYRQAKEQVVLWGTGSPKREFMHVDDLAEATLFLMENYNKEEIVNAGTGKDISIKELAIIIKDSLRDAAGAHPTSRRV